MHQVPPVSQREAIGYMLGADMLLVEEFESVDALEDVPVSPAPRARCSR